MLLSVAGFLCGKVAGAGPVPRGVARRCGKPDPNGRVAEVVAGQGSLMGQDRTHEPITVPSVPSSVAAVRRYTVEACRSAGLTDLTDTAALLVSEVATNALVHGSGDVRVVARADGRVLRVEVQDDEPQLPRQRSAGDLDEGGRGLALLDALATAWGTDGRADGKTVWFELRLS